MTGGEHFRLAHKPTGVVVGSHSAADFAGYLSRHESRSSFAADGGLDAQSSGAVAVPAHAQAAREMEELRTRRQLRRLFRLVTDRARRGATSIRAGDCQFVRVRKRPDDGILSLWEVDTSEPSAAVRALAAAAGLAIMGDALAGGTAFPRLLLHCRRLQFQSRLAGAVVCEAPDPHLFGPLALLGDDERAHWLSACDRRQGLFGRSQDATQRLLHTDVDGVRCDLLGAVLWFYWYRPEAPTAKQRQLCAEVTASAGARHWIVRRMQNRGTHPNQRRTWTSPDCPEAWTGMENGVRYQLRSDRGLSPGLFLDQRCNRLWLRDHSRGERVLNLFSYTGSFGLCAALGGAACVVNVDTSRRSHDWARQNLSLNGVDEGGFEFAAIDARLFLQGCRRRGRVFDKVICDAPSFSRGREGLFRIEHHLPNLVRDAVSVLRPEGRMLVSCNYENWSREQFEGIVRGALPPHAELAPAPQPDWDFELPGENGLLKSVLVTV